MPNILAGYDMVVAITQNEINSQFLRMATSPQPTIDTYVSANGLSSGWGGSSFLSSYLRGYVDAPTVQLHDASAPDSHDHVFFQVTFRAKNVSPDQLTALGLDPSTLVYPNDGDGNNGYLLKHEDLEAPAGNQSVYYWLRQSKVGTIMSYALVPVVYFLSQGMHALVNLDGLQVRFKVMLAQIPTTPDAVQDLVNQGLVDPSVLQAIQAGGFTEDAFSLQQLFLNFDTVDYTQWALQPVDGATQVDVILVEPNQYLSESLTELTQQNQDFIANFSTALQYAFGMNGQNSAGATPYILGINAQSKNPVSSDPGQPPSLVPTWIGFGTSFNANTDGLSTLNYQVLGGTNPQARVPEANDGSVIYVTSTLVTDNAYSGAMLFAEDTLFTPFVFSPIQQAVGITSGWSTTSTATTTTMTATQAQNGVVELDEDHTWAGEGIRQKVTEDTSNTCTVQVSGNTITISGSCYQRQDITIDMVVATKPIPFHWWQWCTVSYTQTITVTVTDNNQLMFVAGTMTTSTDGPKKDQNLGGTMMDAVSSALNVLTLGYFDPMNDALDSMANGIKNSLQAKVNSMNANLTGGVSGNFISPTGDVFFMSGPRFDTELNLLLDVTYRV